MGLATSPVQIHNDRFGEGDGKIMKSPLFFTRLFFLLLSVLFSLSPLVRVLS